MADWEPLEQKKAEGISDSRGTDSSMETLVVQTRQVGKGSSFLRSAVLCLISGIIGAALMLGGQHFLADPTNDTTGAGQAPGVTDAPTTGTNTEGIQQIINIESTVDSVATAVAKKVLPSIVGVSLTTQVSSGWFGQTTSSRSEGSGVIYTSDGYIITNYHVVEGTLNSAGEVNPSAVLEVYLYDDPQTALPATLVGYDISADLAVLKIQKEGLTAVEIGKSDQVLVGDIAIALGNPGGLEFLGSVSQGIISGLNRTIQVENSYEDLKLIQTDAAINPGNSGGALVDATGKLIGINSVKLAAEGYEGMGFAIPSNDVVEICNGIIQNKDNPSSYFGIEEDTRYTAELLERNGYPGGVVIGKIATGSPAEEAGLEEYDIIVAFQGKTVRTFAELIAEKQKCQPGDQVVVRVYRQTSFRGGEYMEFTVTLA